MACSQGDAKRVTPNRATLSSWLSYKRFGSRRLVSVVNAAVLRTEGVQLHIHLVLRYCWTIRHVRHISAIGPCKDADPCKQCAGGLVHDTYTAIVDVLARQRDTAHSLGALHTLDVGAYARALDVRSKETRQQHTNETLSEG